MTLGLALLRARDDVTFEILERGAPTEVALAAAKKANAIAVRSVSS